MPGCSPHFSPAQCRKSFQMPTRNQRTPEARAYRVWYKTPTWQRIRRQQLAAEPLCQRCKAEGRIVPATVVHHVEPHKGDWAKFISGPFESLCKQHHDVLAQREERRGHTIGSDIDGRPLAPDHPWNQT